MTNPWYDLKNTTLAWIEGSNRAECHPSGLKNLMKAKKNGLKIMHVDVRYTRTSKIADYFIQIRPGTDIAFLGAIINYVIQNHKYDAEYLRLHTNAHMLINPAVPTRSATPSPTVKFWIWFGEKSANFTPIQTNRKIRLSSCSVELSA